MSLSLPPILAAYLGDRDFLKQLRLEVPGVVFQMERLLLSAAAPMQSVWAKNIWLAPELIPIDSIKDAGRKLRARHPLWAPYEPPGMLGSRVRLIQAELPYFATKPLSFLDRLPETPLASYTLLDRDLMLASISTSSPRANGDWDFREDKIGPPSRAYLKLWEVFTRFGRWPKEGELCLDAGASPGGWSFVLMRLKAQILAFDRSPLCHELMTYPGLKFVQQSAFQTNAKLFPDVAWVFSDMACYPDKLLNWVKGWLIDGRPRNFVCTLKLQGEDDLATVRAFQSIPGGQLVHLHHNKHELTWVKFGEP